MNREGCRSFLAVRAVLRTQMAGWEPLPLGIALVVHSHGHAPLAPSDHFPQLQNSDKSMRELAVKVLGSAVNTSCGGPRQCCGSSVICYMSYMPVPRYSIGELIVLLLHISQVPQGRNHLSLLCHLLCDTYLSHCKCVYVFSL